MRRKDRELTDPAAIDHILAKARVMHLGLHDGDYPYVVPLHYGYTFADGRLTLYAHSAAEGHKLDCIRADGRVFVEIDTDEAISSGGEKACAYGAYYACVMGRGRAVIVTDPAEKARGLEALMRCQTGRDWAVTPEMAERVAVVRIDVESCTAKARRRAPGGA